jgi:hypothetical protein
MSYERDEAMRMQEATEEMIRMRQRAETLFTRQFKKDCDALHERLRQRSPQDTITPEADHG